MAHFVEAAGKDMQEESAQEGDWVQGGTLAFADTEGDVIIANADQARVGRSATRGGHLDPRDHIGLA